MIYDWKKIVKHGIPLLTICACLEILAGQMLQGDLKAENSILIRLPIFLISIPVINSVGGNIGSVLGARLASGLHVGYVTISIKDKKMHENLVCIISLVSVLTAFWSFKKGLDPDDTVAPVVTTVGDTLGILFLFILIGVVV